jgi:zinc transport system ATP-binding protein
VNPPALHFHHVTVTFGDSQVLEDVNFDIEAGQFLAIVGPNGAGKSTLFRVALGLVNPTRGHTAIYGQGPREAAPTVGYVPQLKTFDRSFPASALELIVTGIRRAWPARVTQGEHKQAAEALESVGAGHLLTRSLARLSGGELQRVFLARSIVRQPDLVLLDEPATGVDFLAENDLYDLLEHYQTETGAAIAMITHDLAAARYHASQVLVLNRRVHGFGCPEEVLREDYLRGAYGHVGHAHDFTFG